MTQANVYSIEGDVVGKIDIPTAFDAPCRPDLIKKVVIATANNNRQPYGPSKMSGMRHSVSTWGKGRGTARVQRIHDGKRATESPNNVSGRRAHPPRPERIWDLKVNKKERTFARISALAATASAEYVKARGHQFDDSISFPIVVDDNVQSIATTTNVYDLFEKIGISHDIDRAKEGTKIRAGRGKMRNRKYRVPVSVLFVVSDKHAPIVKGANNLPGVEIRSVNSINAAVLAPGGDIGRLTVYTKSAIAKIGEWKI